MDIDGSANTDPEIAQAIIAQQQANKNLATLLRKRRADSPSPATPIQHPAKSSRGAPLEPAQDVYGDEAIGPWDWAAQGDDAQDDFSDVPNSGRSTPNLARGRSPRGRDRTNQPAKTSQDA